MTPGPLQLRSPAAQLAAATLGTLLLGAHGRAHAPHDVINELAVSPTFHVDRTLFASITLTDHQLLARSVDGGVTWRKTGVPMLALGSATAFDFSPDFATDGIAFASTPGMGVWRTDDHGDTWRAMNDGLPSLSVSDVAVSPRFDLDAMLLVATPNGCARSTDGGQSWAVVATGLRETLLNEVAFAPSSTLRPTAFLCGNTVHRSDDGGVTWTPLVTYSNAVSTLAVSPDFATDGTLALAFGRFGGGVRTSMDGGASFQVMNAGLTDLRVTEVAVAEDGAVFAAGASGQAFRAPAVGGAWTEISAGFEPPSPLTQVHNTEAVVSPRFATDHSVFIAGFEGLFRSGDGGDSWRQANIYSQELNRHLAFSPAFATDRQLFTGDYGGGVFLYVDAPPPPPGTPPSSPAVPAGVGAVAAPATTEAWQRLEPPPVVRGTAWEARSNTLSTLFSDALAVSPTFPSDQTLFYAYTDLRRSTDAGLHWTMLPKPAAVGVVRGIAVSPDFSNDRTLIFGSTGGGIYRSTDAGDSWTLLAGGLPPQASTHAIVFSPDFAGDRTVFLGTADDGVWRTSDGGDTWTACNAGLTSLHMRALSIAALGSGLHTLFAGTVGDGVFVSHSDGAVWQPLDGGLPEDVPLIIESFAISPGYATDHTVLVATLEHGVFLSTHGGGYWKPANDGLPDPVALRALAISPDFAADRTVVAGTFDGVWITRNAGASWSPLPGWIRADDSHPSVFHSLAPFAAAAAPGPPPGAPAGAPPGRVAAAPALAASLAAACVCAGPPAASFGGGFPGVAHPEPGGEARTSGWVKTANVQNHGNAYVESSSAGDWEEYEFRGTRIEWYANLTASSGIASVAIDGQPAGRVDLWSPEPLSQQLVFSRDFPGGGAHVIRVQNTGQQNRSSGGLKIQSDGYALFY